MTDTLQAPPAPGVQVVDKEEGRRSRPLHWLILLVGVVALQLLFAADDVFPAAWDTLISDPVDRFQAWVRANRLIHPAFTGFFIPLSDAVEWGLVAVEEFLLWLPWFFLPVTVFLVIARNGDWKPATVAALAMLYPGLVGLWEVTMETLSLMTIAVLVCLAIGIPLGVWAALRPGVERAIRPVLDAMQTIPAPVYFIPIVLFFGIRQVPATIATVIYALAPSVRLTTLGIKGVPPASVEASRMFGATPRQTLFKVQLPMALPTIMTGVNQTIMMALGIVVIASLLGAGGLGQEVLDALQQRSTGRGLAAGLAIVAVAMVLDRVGKSLAYADRTKPVPRRRLLFGLGLMVGMLVIGRAMNWIEFPAVWEVNILDPLDNVVAWARDNLSFITRPVNDFIVAGLLIPVRDFLIEFLAWPVLIFFTAWVCWRVKGPGLAFFAAVSLAVVGLLGMWELSLQTLTQVVAAVIVALLIAIPVGIWAGRNPKVEAFLGPILDGLQTIPAFVYIIPVVYLFTIGQVPGIIASVLYAIVPGIRITALGIRQVPEESVEASQTFGATPRQTMFGVRIPLAGPTIMVAVNQVIIMVLATVIIAGLVGGGALGFETVRALTRGETGLGFEVAIAIVVMAMILDRLTQGWAQRLQPPSLTH
ncbi:MAG TPA: ABC transporter permease subunit [Acidimicrobiia bacterium]|nr:ABC transporter permease subunit [Acidimicrobiia bacterium]